MLTLMWTMMLIFLLSNTLTLGALLLSKKSLYEREKNSPFNCGFDPINPPRLPFSLKFFILTVIFLIFDVEITLLLPMISTLMYSSLMNWSVVTIVFILILTIGLFHEWKMNTLKWSS